VSKLEKERAKEEE